jgi:hypothetical protein
MPLGPEWVTSSGLIMSRLGQVSLTKPTYRRIVLRCCSVPQAKPSPDYEYRISLRRHPVGHPSSSTRDSASRAVPSSIRVRRDGYREAGEWQQAGGDQRDRAAQKVFARAGSRKPRSDQHQECSTTDNHGYRRLGGAGPTTSLVVGARGGSDRRPGAVDLVDDDDADPAGPDIGEQALQRRQLQIGAR